ncbi:hypothetical protein [Streptomyces lateritius]|uniref:hypothetical protein n=1 Tax=Streptomyces lateritius TaxID=67313 RepID=UPI001C8C63EA|nr:hypothetical protein [Streptomyces lateritius]MBX9426771.1 hypothetical protein [Streptomyces lateritius]
MSNDDVMTYARSDSVEGLLQRGRGLGAVRALQGPREAAPLVYDGIRRDWRWDSCDDRARYLAGLIRDLGLSSAPVVELLAGDEDQCRRAVGVLRLLALDDGDEAREALRSHVREGVHWVHVLESVTELWPLEWWEDLGEVARARIDGEPEPPWFIEPWTRFGIEVQRPASGPTPHDLTGLADDELLDLLTGTRPGAGSRVEALRELSRRDPVEGLIPPLVTPDGHRPLPLLRQAVAHLGALAVPAARRWVGAEQGWLTRLGSDVLADHLGPEVIPVLVAELAEQWRTRTWCGPDATAKRLARFGPAAAGAVADLRRFWLHTPHSYERAAYLEALAVIDPGGLDYTHTESLWDCEERARLLGVAHAPAHPEALERIAALRDDPMETPDVRAGAEARRERGAAHRADRSTAGVSA